MKKIYFAGSIRGGRNDADLYKRIIEFIQREHIVLTEHVGDLSLSKTEGMKNRDVVIYEQDMSWLRESDLVEIWFDHDLGENAGTGYDSAKYLVEFCIEHNMDLPDYYIQSNTPAGKLNIDSYLKSFLKSQNN